jgi:hypothetical protein
MAKLKRLTLTDELLSHIGLVWRARALAGDGIERMQYDLERVELADAVISAFLEQSAQPTRRLPERVTAISPVVEVSLTRKRRRRA